jgi:O-antigen/teichoic acid export membrane protein
MTRDVEMIETETAVSHLQPKIISGIGWTFAQLLVERGFGFVAKLILARLLLPEYFGIIGMAVVFTGLINTINDLGMAAALIQYKQERLRRIHYDTVFWLSTLFSIGTFLLLLVAIGPFAAWFYDEPLLTLVVPAIGISVCLNPLNLVHRVQLTRELRFKALGIISSIASVVGGVGAIFLALLGAGVWSIVAQSVLATLVSIPLMWRTTRWWPRLQFSKEALQDVFSFGVYDTLVRTAVFLTKNIDYLLIGKLLGANLLGIYTLAFLLTDTFRQQLMGILNKVMFPVYGQLQDNVDSIKRYYVQVIKYNTLAVGLFMVIFLLYAAPLLNLLFGSEWEQAAFPLQAMAIASIIHAIGGTSAAVLKGIGRVDLDFKMYMVKTVLITIPVFFIGVYFYGINGAAVAVVIHKLASRFMYQYQLKRLVGVSEYDVWLAAKPTLLALVAAAPIALVVYTYFDVAQIVVMLTAVLLTALLYSAVGLFLIRDEARRMTRLLAARYQAK